MKTIKKAPKGLRDSNMSIPEVGNMFEELIGTSRVDLYYAIPRFDEMTRKLKNFCGISVGLTERFFFDDIDSYNQFVDFQTKTLELCKLHEKVPKISQEDRIFKKFKENDILEFTKFYNEFRNSRILKDIMVSAVQLKSISLDLKEKKKTWINKSIGFHFKPLAFCPDFDLLSLKGLQVDDMRVINWTSYLNQLFCIGEYFSDELQKPDIDIKKFCNTVIIILTSAEKEPGLQGCNQAFSKIKESMNMLEENFSRYYKEFICAEKNSNSIFVSFIKDVTDKNSNASLGIVAQFTKILNFYIDQMERQGIKLDPAVSKLASQAMSGLDSVSKKGNIGKNERKDKDKKEDEKEE